MWRSKILVSIVLAALTPPARGQQPPPIDVRFMITAATVKDRIPQADLIKLEGAAADTMAALLRVHFGFLTWATKRGDFRLIGILAERSIGGAPELYVS